MALAWYAVHTIAGHENKVTQIIQRVAMKEGLWDREIMEILIPTEQTLRNRNGKREVAERKVFPGYILIRMNLTEESYRLVKKTSGVTGFVSSGTKPVAMRDDEVKAILERLNESREKPHIPWAAGDAVRVSEGPFQDFPGKVIEVIADKQKLRVLLTIFGRDTPVELDFSQVEKGS
ncbi:MAG: transcription termination/antitermination protein NusG [Fimbriimonadales bacterium]